MALGYDIYGPQRSMQGFGENLQGLGQSLMMMREKRKQEALDQKIRQIFSENMDQETGMVTQTGIQKLYQVNPQLGLKVQTDMEARKAQSLSQQKTKSEIGYKELQSQKLRSEGTLRELRSSFDDKSWKEALTKINPELAAQHPYYDPELKEGILNMMLPLDKRLSMELERKRIEQADKSLDLRQAALESMHLRNQAAKTQADLSVKRFDRTEKEQDVRRATKAAESTKELWEEILVFKEIDKNIPGGLYGAGGVSGFGFGSKPLRKFWKTKEANAIRGPVQRLINVLLNKRSGTAVTDKEFERLETEFGINTTGTIDEFRRALQRQYEGTTSIYERFRRADPEAFEVIEKEGSKGYRKYLERQETLTEIPSEDDFDNMSPDQLIEWDKNLGGK